MTRYEIKKIFSRKASKAALLLLLAVLILVLNFTINDLFYVNEQGENEYGLRAIAKVREVKKEWAGELTEDQIRKVIEENVRIAQTPEALSENLDQNNVAFSWKQGLMDIRNLLVYDYGGFSDYNYYLPDSLSPEAASEFYPNRIKNLKEWLDTEAAGEFTEGEKAYLIDNYESLETPLYYDYQDGWYSLFQYAPTVIMVTTLVLGFLCAGIFSSEFQQRASAVFYASFYGRDRAVAAKIKAGLVVVTVIYWSMILLYTVLVLGIFGADGAGCQIQSTSSGWKSIYHITNLQEYLLTVFGGYAGCLFMMLLTMLVSAKTNSAVLAVLVPFVLIFLPSFLSEVDIPLQKKVLGLLPDQLLQMTLVVKYFNLYGIGGKIFPAAPLLLILYTSLCIVMLPSVYRIYRKKQA